jgi:hypothetical protein
MPTSSSRTIRSEGPNSKTAQGPAAAPAAAPAPPVVSGDFEARLALLKGQGSAGAVPAGRISIIGLDRAREKFGNSWERLAGRVDRIARNAIERYLLPGDIYTVWRETSYLIVFASLELDRANMKCLLIADEVMKALFGEGGNDLISVDSAVTRIEAGGLMQALLDDQLFPPDGKAKPSVPAPAPEPMKPAAPLSHRDLPGDLSFAYRPIWDTTLGALSAYLCVPMLRSGDAPTHIDAVSALGGSPDAVAELDFAVQEHVCGTLQRMQSEGCRVLVILAVHFDTLAAAARRRRYLEALTRSVSAELAKLLVIEIIDVPVGVPPSRMFDIAGALRRLCRGVAARARIECADFAAFAGAHVHAVGCDIGASHAAELTLMQLLGRFSRAAEKAGVACFVHGLRSISLTGAAVGAGFRYIDGEGVAKLVQRPEPVTHFNLDNIYRPILDTVQNPDAETLPR